MKYDLQNMATFGVAGNFTGHLEQAGEAKDFVNVKTKEANAPKAVFPTYIPSENNRMLGIVAFDGCVDSAEAPAPNVVAKTIEIKRNGEVVCTGKGCGDIHGI